MASALPHAALGAAAVLPLSHCPFLVGVAAIAATLPDLDTSRSAVGRYFPWPSAYGGWGRWPGIRHRGPVHSIGAGLIVASLLLPVGWTWAAAVLLGWLSHLALDATTPTPQQLLWPISRRGYRLPWGISQRGPTGKLIELSVLVGSLLAVGHAWR